MMMMMMMMMMDWTVCSEKTMRFSRLQSARRRERLRMPKAARAAAGTLVPAGTRSYTRACTGHGSRVTSPQLLGTRLPCRVLLVGGVVVAGRGGRGRCLEACLDGRRRQLRDAAGRPVVVAAAAALRSICVSAAGCRPSRRGGGLTNINNDTNNNRLDRVLCTDNAVPSLPTQE
jgi:hypothetical protein